MSFPGTVLVKFEVRLLVVVFADVVTFVELVTVFVELVTVVVALTELSIGPLRVKVEAFCTMRFTFDRYIPRKEYRIDMKTMMLMENIKKCIKTLMSLGTSLAYNAEIFFGEVPEEEKRDHEEDVDCPNIEHGVPELLKVQTDLQVEADIVKGQEYYELEGREPQVHLVSRL
jgi:hypothetical protein